MKFRFQMPGLAVLLVMLFTLSHGVAMAEDGKGHGGGDGQTQSDDSQGDNTQSGDSSNSGEDGGDKNGHEANETPQKEQEEARKAVASGRAAPLTVLLKKLKTDYPGQILDVALVENANKLTFVVKYIDKSNQVKTVTLDALTLEDD